MNITGHDALIIVDVQNDFCSGSSLAVPEGDKVAGVPSRLAGELRGQGAFVFATQDWHPPGHSSFKESGGPWPPTASRAPAAPSSTPTFAYLPIQ